MVLLVPERVVWVLDSCFWFWFVVRGNLWGLGGVRQGGLVETKRGLWSGNVLCDGYWICILLSSFILCLLPLMGTVLYATFTFSI
jgi:hypothetical protein